MQRPKIEFEHDKDISLEDLIDLLESYIPSLDKKLIAKGYAFAKESHEGQKRSSGEDFFVHPVNVAFSAAKLHMDQDSIVAALLHDVIEDCDVSLETIEKEFSKEIAGIVSGLTKISKIPFKTQRESQVENFRKMVIAMAQDLRVIIVKFCDRIHNMRTLQYIAEDKQTSKAQETLDIYVPLANRLGMHAIKAELEDLCLRYLKPAVYKDISKYIATKKEDREKYIKTTVEILQKLVQNYEILATIKGRPKHFYSIYKKMVSHNLQFDEVQDLLAFRIIVDNIGDCYKCLGIIHSTYVPLPGRFKDYIAIPKINNYQSLHTTVIGPQTERIEIQIRTRDMDHIAEHGIAAHWKYKEKLSDSKKFNWIKELIEYNKNTDSYDLIDIVKNDLNIEEVFVFTPQGEVLELSQGATALDFAYTVHTEVGNHCIGAKVNNRMVPLKHRLHSGDIVQIITSSSHHPNKDWLKIAQTGRAKSKIKQWIQKEEKEKNIELGKELLEKGLKVFNLSFKTINKSEDFVKIAKKYNTPSKEDVFAMVGSGKLEVNQVLTQLPQLQGESETQIKKISIPLSQKISQGIKSNNPIIVDGMDDIMVRLAKCCAPIPGDPIIGHITRGRGITVHTTNCPTLEKLEFGRNIEVYWNQNLKFKHPANIRILTTDKPGMLSELSQVITKTGINIRSALARVLPENKASFIFEIEVEDYSELLKVLNTIETTKDVINVTRAQGSNAN